MQSRRLRTQVYSTMILVLAAFFGVADASRIQPSKIVHKDSNRLSAAMRNISLHNKEESSEDKVQVQHNSTPVVANSSFVETSSGAKAKVVEVLRTWIPDDSSSSKVSKILMISGISVFLIAVLCCSCCVMDRFMGGGRSRKHTHFEEDLCPRITHLHDKKPIYEWDQNSTVANIYMKPPPNVEKKDLEIKISSKKLKVGRKGKPPFLQEDLYAPICEEESSWRLRSNGELKINLRKAVKGEWPKVLNHRSDTDEMKTSWIQNHA